MRRHENDPNEGKASLDHNIVSVLGHCIHYQRIRTIQEYIIKKKKKRIKKEKEKRKEDYSRVQELSKTRLKKERTIDIKARELQIIKKD